MFLTWEKPPLIYEKYYSKSLKESKSDAEKGDRHFYTSCRLEVRKSCGAAVMRCCCSKNKEARIKDQG
jgi:hypothetical protein